MASTSCSAGGRSERGGTRWRRALAALGAVAVWHAPLAARAADAACGNAAGPLQLQAESLEATYAAASGAAKARAAAALGRALLRLNRLAAAEPLLDEAEAGAATARERAAAAVDLGQIHLARRDHVLAVAAWERAIAHAGRDADVALAVELNRLLLPDAKDRAARLEAASRRLDELPAGAARTRHALHIAAQARDAGTPALAHRMAEAVRAHAAGDDALLAESDDILAALYERERRDAEALRLSERGLLHAQRAGQRELLVPLEWRVARLAQRLGRLDDALAAYRRAVEHVEAVRIDIPVRYLDGRSSFRETLEPVYLGLTAALLQRSTSASGAERTALLRQARDTVELIKQTELEDYLRDRCSVGSVRREIGAGLAAGTAIYYPIILDDRLELLVETAAGIDRVAVPVSAAELKAAALDFVAALRSRAPFRVRGETLYRWLLQPVEPLLAERGVHTLVAVPDGVLRLVPLAALWDGRDFVLRRLTVTTAPGLTLTAAAPAGETARRRALVAGMSEPGPVVEKLPREVVDTVLEPAAQERIVRGSDGRTLSDSERRSARSTALREALALPGVKQEVREVSAAIGSSTALLDATFTRAALEQHLLGSDYGVVHIASHGVFGDSADTTFIMTYDELLTLDGLQQLLAGPRRGGSGAPARRPPIELITLSACQTAEGDDRAPLGMSGTAIKARARSALGTLWPVSDDAAQRLMSRLYKLLADGQPKAAALRAAQLELVARPATYHPFFWAPFILIGDWQ